MKTDFHVPGGHSRTAIPDPDLRIIATAISNQGLSKRGSDLTEHVIELRDAVHWLRHCAQLSPATVLETLAQVDEAVAGSIETNFYQRRVGLSLPLTRPELDLCTAMCSLYHQIAKAYVNLIPDRTGRFSDDSLSWAPNAAYGAMRYFTKILLCVYQAYQNVPDNLWRRMHALYEHASALGIQDEPVSEPHGARITLKILYQRALLIGLSNPYRFPFRAIQFIDGYIRAHVTQTELTGSASRPTNECLFVVDPRIDRPAIPMLPRVRSGNSGACLILDTLDISVGLHQRIKALSGASDRLGDRSLAGFSEAEELETFKALLTQWGFHPIRSVGRRQT
ncbi:MAG: hypothetical protein OEQ18_05000, partial [Gammaproteobacteria bacterium]|nr:hypothetical protein [Gammaproteobacteria bacterium]